MLLFNDTSTLVGHFCLLRNKGGGGGGGGGRELGRRDSMWGNERERGLREKQMTVEKQNK